MKKTLVSLLLIASSLGAQTVFKLAPPSSILQPASGNWTLFLNSSANNTPYVKKTDNTIQSLQNLMGLTPGAATWGSITGTITNQGDLKNFFIPIAGTYSNYPLTGAIEFKTGTTALSSTATPFYIGAGNNLDVPSGSLQSYIKFYHDASELDINQVSTTNTNFLQLLDNHGWQLTAADATNAVNLNSRSTYFRIGSSYALFAGAEYLADYSAHYSARSLIDNGYATATFAPISYTNSLSATLSAGKIYVGNGSNVGTAVTPSLSGTPGTFSLATTGAFTFPDAATGTRGLLNSTDWNIFNNKSPAVGSTSLTTIGTVTTGVWNGSIITGQYGGTGISNIGKTITLGGNLTTSGANSTTITTLGSTNVTIPTAGTVITRDSVPLKTHSVLGAIVTNDWTSGHFTSSGSVTATFTNNTIQVSGSDASGNSFFTYDNYVVSSENWYGKVTYVVTNTISSTSYGLGIGVHSVNAVPIKLNALAYVATDNGVSHTGGLYYFMNNSALTFTIVSQNTSNLLTPTVGDTIEQCLIRFRNQYYFYARNLTDGSVGAISYVVDPYNYSIPVTAGGGILNNAGKFYFCSLGGNQTITRYEFGSLERTGAPLVIMGNSRTEGFYAGQYVNTLKQTLTSNIDDIVLLGGVSDRTVEAVQCTTEVGMLAPKYALFFVGYNDIATGVSSGTWQANITAIYNYCISHSIVPYFYVESGSDAVNISAVLTYVSANYPNNYIDGNTSFMGEGNRMLMQYQAYDKVHDGPLGVQKIKSIILASPINKIFKSIR